MSVRRPQVILVLADLLDTDAMGSEHRRARRRDKRSKKRKRKHRSVQIAWDGPHAETTTACSRFRAAGLWAIDSFNGNCGNGPLDYLSRSTADACMLQ